MARNGDASCTSPTRESPESQAVTPTLRNSTARVVRRVVEPFVWLGCIFLMCMAQAQADADVIAERGYLRDASGSLSPEEVRSAAFTPFTGVLSRGFDPTAVYWLRLRIPPGDAAADPWVLRVQPSWHDELQLHDPADPHTTERATGDRHPWSASEFPSLSHAFLLKKTPEVRDVFLRVQSVHSYQIDTELLQLEQAHRSEQRRMMTLSLYISGMALILLGAIASQLVSRDRTVAVFAVTQFVALLYSMLTFGMGRMALDGLVPSARLDQAHIMIIIAYVLTSLQFYSFLLREHGVRRWAGATVTVLSLLPVLWLLLYFAGRVDVALPLNALNVAVFCPVAFIVAWFGLRPASGQFSRLPRWALRLFFSLLLLIGLSGSLPLLGWAKATTLSQVIFLVHGPLLTSIIGAVLIYRVRHRIRWHESEIALANARTKQERLARLEQTQFMAMINHEVKTPLSALKLLVAGQDGQGKAEAQVDTVVALLDRCLLYDQLSAGTAALRKERFQPAEVTRQCIDKTGNAARFDVALNSAQDLEGDPVLYAVIVSNLLDNALKYAAPASPIRVTLEDVEREGNSSISLSVANTIGRAGLPHPGRVFERYYRAESARHIPGTGLGLYLVRSLAGMLGGTAVCFPAADTIRFEVCLPR